MSADEISRGARVRWIPAERFRADAAKANADGEFVGISPKLGHDIHALELVVQEQGVKHVVVAGAESFDLDPLARCVHLRSLSLDSAVAVDLGALVLLRSLICQWHPRLVLPASNAELNRLGLSGCEPPSRDLSWLPAWSGLQMVALVQPRIRTLAGIERCKGLLEVTVFRAPPSLDVSALGKLEELSRCQLEGCASPEQFESIRACSKLKTLSVIRCKRIPSLKFLTELPELEGVHLVGTDVDDGSAAIAKQYR